MFEKNYKQGRWKQKQFEKANKNLPEYFSLAQILRIYKVRTAELLALSIFYVKVVKISEF